MLESGNEGVHRYYEQLIGQLNDMVYLIRGKLSKMARVTIGALAVIDVHARDVMKKVRTAAGVRGPWEIANVYTPLRSLAFSWPCVCHDIIWILPVS